MKEAPLKISSEIPNYLKVCFDFSETKFNFDMLIGSIIRCMHRLDELLQEMLNASRVINDQKLEEKFETARKLLRRERGVVFSSSLYT